MNDIAVISFPDLNHLPSLILGDLTGKEGSNRAPIGNCQIEADSDFAAVNTWLLEYKDSPSTYRVYQKEVERLLLWCVYQHKKPLSSLKRDDFECYIEFLKNPQPRALWCGSKGGRGQTRGSAKWKPFTSPLNAGSLTTAITIINSMMTYLVDAGYLQANPLRLLRKARRQPHFEERKLDVQARILEKEEWQAMLQTLQDLPEEGPHDKDEKYRLRFIVGMLFFLGLRVGELTTHTWQAFRQIEGQWWFIVKGKGNKWGKIPINQNLFDIATQFRAHLRLPPIPQVSDNFPLVCSWRSTKGLTARYINYLLKDLALRTAQTHFKDDLAKQAKLAQFSAHWLRHLSATLQDRAGVKFSHIRANLRHESDETTRLYVHAEDALRHADMEKIEWDIG
jgi:integrase